MDWRARADEMRNLAEDTQDPRAKETMLSIAHDYDLLAGQTPAPPLCRRCRHRTNLANILNVAKQPTLYVRPPEYVFQCPQCKRVDTYYLEYRTSAGSDSVSRFPSFVSTSTDI
jgi:hypothetical protein